MKYVIINGSPRIKNTWKIVKQVQKNLDGEFEEIHLMKENIPLCKGCFKCIMCGEDDCLHHDKVKPIIDKMHSADGIIVASPVYAMNVPAMLKNFLDHTAYLFHRPEFFTKKALVVVSTAGAGHKKVANYLDETLRHWGVNKVYQIKVACGGKEHLETSAIDKISVKFAHDVESGKFHSPNIKDIVFFDVWKAMAYSKDSIPADEEFWIKHDLVNNDFSPKIKLSMFKRLFSKVIFFIMRRVIK